MTSRKKRLDSLISRMPKDIRDEIARLDMENEKLRKQIEARGEAKSRIILSTSSTTPNIPLPEDARVRFLGPPGKNQNSSYIEFFIAYEGAKKNAVEVRCGNGRLVIHPGASNSATLLEGDL